MSSPCRQVSSLPSIRYGRNGMVTSGQPLASQAGNQVLLQGGNAVCILQSLQSGFGSSLISGDTGILLNNRMTYWRLDAAYPNCLMSGKRVRHTMNPVIVTKTVERS